MELPKRKHTRLRGYDYSAPGYYFMTVCTQGKQKLLCDIVGTGVLDGPKVTWTAYGEIVREQLRTMSDFYNDIKIENYVVMPNHVHLILHILGDGDGPSGRPVPTRAADGDGPSRTNSKVAKFMGTFKRFCNKECGKNIWQARSYDHVIRDEDDYWKIRNYIDHNPARWVQDRFYIE